MTSPVLNRVWRQTLWIKANSYAIFYKLGLVWLTLMLVLGFTTACLLATLFFVLLRSHTAKAVWGLSISPEGDCRYYPSRDAEAIDCQLISVRHALFWCHLVLQPDDGKSYQLVVWLHSLNPQEKRRFNALCHNWSQEILT